MNQAIRKRGGESSPSASPAHFRPRLARATSLHAVLLVSVLLPGCAGTSPVMSTHAASAGCAEISAEMDRTEAVRRAALAEQSDAWKAVVPFAVAARYAKARSAVSETDERLAALAVQSDRRGCTLSGGDSQALPHEETASMR